MDNKTTLVKNWLIKLDYQVLTKVSSVCPSTIMLRRIIKLASHQEHFSPTTHSLCIRQAIHQEQSDLVG